MSYRHVKDPTEVVVFFTIDKLPEAGSEEYARDDERMYDIVSSMRGFISFKHYTSDEGDDFGLVRFQTEDALEAWRTNPEHRVVQQKGREKWDRHYLIRVCKVVHEYEFWQNASAAPAGGSA